MKERKELKVRKIAVIEDEKDNQYSWSTNEFYNKDDVDPLLDKYEARIKELECEIGYYKPHSRFLDSECDKYVATIQQREARIKELETENNRLRYERLIKTSILYRNHATEYNWEQLMFHNKIKNMSPGEFIIRMAKIADVYEARAKKLNEE